MMNILGRFPLWLLLALLANPLWAGEYDYRQWQPYSVADVSLDQATSRVKRRTGGRVLSAETRENTHRIKVLTPKGSVRSFRVDVKSGRNLDRRR